METALNIEKIVVPVDFTEGSRNAFYVALRVARLFDANVVALHVMEPIASFVTGEDVERQAAEVVRMEEGIRRRVNDLYEKGGLAVVDRRKIAVEVRSGKLATEIVRFAYQNGSDLIVLPVQGAEGVRQMLMGGGEAEKVVRRAHCMVLAVKPDNFEVDAEIRS